MKSKKFFEMTDAELQTKLKELKEKYEPEIIVDTINVQDYGMMNGSNVLKAALERL